jgi:hypothetical protein
MDRLLEVLCESGALDETACRWALAEHRERGGGLDTVLLELDLVDEGSLCQALETCYGLPVVARPDEFDEGLSERFPLGFSTSFQMCPLHLEAGYLTALVEAPLSEEWRDELFDLFAVKIEERVTPSHRLALARQKVYGVEVPARIAKLEERLARHRLAPSASALMEQIASAHSLSQGANLLLDFAAHLVEFSCILVAADDHLRIAEVRGEGSVQGTLVAYPKAQCSLAATLRHGGYFLGPIRQAPDEQEFFQWLGREAPRFAMVAPIPVAGPERVMLLLENGPRGIATRWAAELTLFGSRLAQTSFDLFQEVETEAVEELVETKAPESEPEPEPESEPEPEPESKPESKPEPELDPEPVPALSAGETAALSKLRAAAAAEEKPIDVFVDELLAQRQKPAAALVPPQPPADPNVIGDVRGLLEQLATDIPTQLVRGMESAFRQMVPLLASSQQTPAAQGALPAAQPPPGQPTAKPAAPPIVVQPAKPREVPDYRKRRKKARKVKL